MTGLDGALSVLPRLADHLPALISYVDKTGRYVYVNATYADWLGKEVEQIIGRPVNEILPQDAYARIQPELERALAGERRSFDVRISYPDGKERQIQVQYIPDLGDRGEVRGICALIGDVTEARGMQAQLVESEAFLRAIFENAQDGMLLASIETHYFVMANPAICRMLGYSEAELLGRRPEDMHSPEVLPRVQAHIERMKQGNFALEPAMPFLCKDGRTLYADVSASFASVRGMPCLLGIFRDVSERVEAERVMAESQALNQSLLRLSRRLGQARAYKDIAAALRDEIAASIGYRNAWVFVAEEDGRHYQLISAGGEVIEEVLDHPKIKRLDMQGDPYLRELSQADSLVVVEDMRSDPRTDKKMVAIADNRSSVHVPIRLGDRRVGLIGTGSFGAEGVRVPNQAQLDYLLSLANHVATAIDRIQFLDQRQRNEEVLRQERGFVNAILDNAGALILVLDREGRIRRFNKACEDLSRYSFAEAAGRCPWDFLLLPEERERVRAQTFLALAENARSTGSEYANHWLSKDGEKRLIQWHNTPLFDTRGQVEYVVAIGIDVTEKRLVQEALKRSQETYARAEAIAHIGSWDWDIARGALHWTDEIYRIFGLTPQSFDATYQAFLEAIHPEDQQRVIDAVNACVADAATPYSVEHRVVWPGGQIRVVHERGKVYRDAAGTPLRMIGTVHDITERNQAEQELERHRDHLEDLVRARTAEVLQAKHEAEQTGRMLRTVLDAAPFRIFWRDHEGRYLGCNRLFAEDAGKHAPEELVGLSDYDMPWSASAELYRQDDAAVIASGRPKLDFEEPMDLPDGSRIWLETSKVPLRDAAGSVVGILGAFTNITDRKQAEIALQVAKEEAERANLAKSEFLSRMSHELRTPLNAILGFSQLLESDTLQPLMAQQRDSVGEILHAGGHLLELINEVLDLSRIEAGKLQVSLETVRLAAVIKACVGLIQPLAEGKGIRLVDVNGTCCDCAVRADHTRLRQVLLNLLSNAVKYNRPHGTVTLTCSCQGDTVRIGVRDTGAGLTAEQQGRLFTPFERLDADKTSIEGAGIGLALSKRLVELMHGEIGVESEVGVGSTFWIQLPASASVAELAPLPAPAPEHWDILVIEDIPANLRLLERILGRRGDLQLLGAHDARVGLELALAHRPALILLDMEMSGVDAAKVLARLKAGEETRDIPVIGLGAGALAKEVGRSGGLADYLLRPLDVNRVFQAIDQQLRARGAPKGVHPHD